MVDTLKSAVVEKPETQDIQENPANEQKEPLSESVKESKPRPSARGLRINRMFTREGVNPYEEIKWEKRQASITNEKGETIFAKTDVEVPASWSMLAANIVASKYFYGTNDTEVNEISVGQLVHRVARTIADWGLEDGYFASPEDAETYYNELSYLCLNQYAAFNSPVWFNVGLSHVYGLNSKSQTIFCWNEEKEAVVKASDCYKSPQASACFIQAAEDTMDDIMRLATSEAMLFKYGSGTGSDLSTLRSSREKLSGGGTPSGPLSFMRVFDQIAAVIKSGGKTRRAAKMQSLKVDHPDIMEFITCKHDEEKKAKALVKMGYDGSMNGEAYASVAFQNANLSVRVYDEFMRAVLADSVWHTKSVTTGEIVEVLEAKKILQKISEMAHACGDPGLQYDTTINRWHTCPNSGRINASNPCSEYMFIDNSACNLASINLMKFSDEKQMFDIEKFQNVVRIFIIAQEILVDRAGYPTKEITLNSHKFRPLGLGYANLGALIMSLGLPYDSDEGRGVAGAITALMTGTAYDTSASLSAIKGPFDEFRKNEKPMMNVMQMHRSSVDKINVAHCPADLLSSVKSTWDNAIENGAKYGFRNAQVSVLAPTGTIGFMMDCDTTGVEPDIALVKYKQLAGGGMLKITNQTIPPALKRLGYSPEQIEKTTKYIEENDTIENAPDIKPEHLQVFDCAFKPKNGTRFINYNAHLLMMAAVQPFLSGAISKTINMPNNASVDDVLKVYIEGWKLGLKAVAIYRDGSKGAQPVSTDDGSKDQAEQDAPAANTAPPKPFRKRMPSTRQSITHKFEVTGHQGYITVGLYENGAPGEVFITMAKEGSTVGGIMDAFGIAISMCLQYGVPLQALTDKLTHTRFEPSGFTKNPDIPYAKSLVDYIFRWMAITFPEGHYRFNNPPKPEETPAEEKTEDAPRAVEQNTKEDNSEVTLSDQFKHFSEDAPVCDQCGAITVRNGTCYRCFVCGNSMGCS